MELAYAIEYLTTLADGIDPATGEILPEGHICNRGDTVRALYAVLQSAGKKKERKLPPNAGQPWTQEEEQRLLTSYHAGQTIAQLATAHGRTRGAIESRLQRLGELPQRDEGGKV